jgi:peptidoglycan-associated lipoprotein
MNKSRTFSIAVVLSVFLFALWGCPKKAELSAVPEAGQAEQAEAARAEALAQEEKERAAAEALAEEKLAAEADEAKKRAAAEGLKPIFFDFDQTFISDEARAVLKANAGWLRANPDAVIRIEGNCDDRGSKEYNIALGQRRAASAKKYLTDLGISEDRILLISYGEEKPVCEEQTEECRRENRRGDFAPVSGQVSGQAGQ